MSNPTNKKDPRTQLAVVAVAASIISPVMVATPAAAAMESAQQKVAQLRKLALAENPQTPEHVVLRRAVDDARLANPTGGASLLSCTETHHHSSNHSSYHSNCVREVEAEQQ